MQEIEIKWVLHDGGWVDVRVSLGDSSADFDASYICDSLRELVLSTISLLGGSRDAAVRFEEEPSVVFMELVRIDDQRAQLTIARAVDGGYRRWKSVVLEGDVSILRFARAVARVLSRLLTEHGEAGYLARWRRPFPTNEHASLKELLRRASKS
jgi:hypothetical protein